MQFPDARILIFAKAPLPGRANTRLAPLLGEHSAAALHEACIRDTVTRRLADRLAPVVLYSSGEHPVFCELAGLLPLQWREQRGCDLGERMRNAARECLREAGAVLLTGCDAPLLDAPQLQQALALLHRDPVAMLPAEDGGYLMLGLTRDCPTLFSDMPWGGSQVAQLTRERCETAGLGLAELAPGWDIDRPQDLLRLAGEAGLPEDVRSWDAARWGEWLHAARLRRGGVSTCRN